MWRWISLRDAFPPKHLFAVNMLRMSFRRCSIRGSRTDSRFCGSVRVVPDKCRGSVPHHAGISISRNIFLCACAASIRSRPEYSCSAIGALPASCGIPRPIPCMPRKFPLSVQEANDRTFFRRGQRESRFQNCPLLGFTQYARAVVPHRRSPKHEAAGYHFPLCSPHAFRYSYHKDRLYK